MDIKKIVRNLLLRYLPVYSQKIAYYIIPDEMRNINIDLSNESQKRVLISYLPIHKVDIGEVRHANFLHINQMIHYFVQKDYCVDVCTVNDTFDPKYFDNKEYDIIIGFGKPYKSIVKSHNIPVKISFVTENNPLVVAKKYNERVEYFQSRHPGVNIDATVARNQFYDTEQFELSDYCVMMSSLYNSDSMKFNFRKLWTINSNIIPNTIFTWNDVEIRNSIKNTRNKFLWFGSMGLIHKGVDILIDAMNEFSECRCDFYGIADSEKKLFEKIKRPNTFDCGRVVVQSQDFVNKIAYGHCFQIFPSCSEGMSTAVATAMSVGVIPVLTKESGFDPHPSIITLENDSVECVVDAIRTIQSMSDEEIYNMRKMTYDYAKEVFSLKNFTCRFSEIMDELIADAGGQNY